MDNIKLLGSKLSYYEEFEKANKDEFIQKLDSCMINGKWGSGKSIFIQKLVDLGKTKGINILVVDAWRCEYLENPERMIMVELLKNLKPSASKELLNFAGSEIIEKLNKELSTINSGDTSKERIIKTIYKTAKRAKGDSAYIEQMKMLDELAFSYLDEQMLKTLNVDVIMFDELDRVLPETFIEIIKFIKYFNDDSQKVKSSAALNLIQCNAMIKHAYGEHFSSVIYLDKIFKNKMNIENYSSDKGEYIYSEYLRLKNVPPYENAKTYAQYICQYFVVNSDYFNDENIVGYGFEDIELREVEQMILTDLKEFEVLINRRVQPQLNTQLGELIMAIYYVNRLSIHDSEHYTKLMQKLQDFDTKDGIMLTTEGFDIPLPLTPNTKQAIINAMNAKNQNKFTQWLVNIDNNI